MTSISLSQRVLRKMFLLLALLFAGQHVIHVSGQREAVNLGTRVVQSRGSEKEDGNVMVEEDDIVVKEDHVVAMAGMESVDLSFDGLKLVLQTKKGSKTILDGSIRGRARPGRMLAILGPSGAGKSSVLHALGGRIKANPKIELSGHRYLNGVPLSGDSMLPAAFIEQDVNFFPYMTVRETIAFRVELKLGSLLSKHAREEMVEDLMKQMGLTKSADTIVGNAKVRGISGGERKRLSIAVELISSPSIIFLDEPTSGLDSTAATVLVQNLRDLADAGKTVIAVIHQPNQHVFNKFDDVLLVSEGKQMYFGERQHVRAFMEEQGYIAPAEMGTAEHILDCITHLPNEGESPEQAEERMEHLATLARTADVNLGDISSVAQKGLKKFLAAQHGPRSNLLIQFKLLFRRSFREVTRGKSAIVLKLVQQMTTAFIYGGIYKIGFNQASIMDRFGLISLIVIGTTNLGVAKTIRAFPREKAIVANELASKMYRTLPYFIGKTIAELPISGLLTGAFGTIVYKMTGLSKLAGKFRNFLGLLMLHSVVVEAAGLMMGAFSPNTDVALATFPAVIVLSVIFDGRNISEENTPWYFKWIAKVGLIRWAFEGLSVNEFDGIEFETSGPFRGPVAKTGADALARFGMGERTLAEIVKAQVILASSFWGLSFLGLMLSKQKFQSMLPKQDEEYAKEEDA